MEKRDIGAFDALLGQVDRGWEVDRLRRHAGEPDSTSEGRWSYHFRGGGLGCVRYSYFLFRIEDGKVVDIDHGGGHMTIE